MAGHKLYGGLKLATGLRFGEGGNSVNKGAMSMDALISQAGIVGVIGLGMGLLAVLLLSTIAARLSKVIDLLDEIAELVTGGSKKQENETSRVG